MKRFYLLIIIFFSCGALFGQVGQDWLDLGKKEFTKGNYKEALEYYQKAISENSNLVDAYVESAEAYYKLKDYDNQFLVLDNGLKANPNSPLLYYYRGCFYKMVKQSERACRDFDLAIKFNDGIDSMYYEFLFERADAKYDIRDFEGGYQDLLICVEHDSIDTRFLNNISLCTFELGRSDESLSYLLKMLELEPNSDYANMNLGFFYQRMGEYKKSLPYFDKAIELNATEAFAYSNRSYSRLKTGDIEGAMDDINKSIQLNKYNSYAYRNRALIYIEMGKSNKACKDLETALSYGFTKSYGKEVIDLQRKYCK